jgi:uncharacterized ferritin-like protein (DUF455 family)
MIKDGEIKSRHIVHVLQRILEDEIVHLNILNTLFKKYFGNRNEKEF